MHAAQRKRLKIRISAVLISNIPSTSTSPCRLFVSFRCLLDLLLGKSFGHPGRRKRSLRVSALQSPVDVSSYPADDANTAEQVSGKRERSRAGPLSWVNKRKTEASQSVQSHANSVAFATAPFYAGWCVFCNFVDFTIYLTGMGNIKLSPLDKVKKNT